MTVRANTTIASWYAHKNVFVTGGTGFLGICLIEKLLRTVPDIGDIYLLLRPKRGKEIDERLQELKKNSIFETLKATNQNADQILDKLKAVSGDVGQPDLGISTSDRALLVERVNVIFHSAATLDFADPLKSTVDINLLGTRRCLDLGKACRDLNVFVHVSSAYVNSFLLETEEILYDLSQDPDELIQLSDSLSEAELEARAPSLLGEHANSYTFTKQMAEHEVKKCQELFACAIVRPSMITTAWKEPVPGWTMSKNGPQGFVMGATRGVLRRLPVSKEIIYDYIPVDVVCNELLAAGQHAGSVKSGTVEVFHCTSSTVNPFRWTSVEDRINEIFHQYPLKNAVWYPRLVFLPSIWRYKLSAIFVHILPAILLDLLMLVTGGRPILLKLHRNVDKSLSRLSRFIFTEWKFDNERTKELQEWLHEDDKVKYNLDVATLNWSDYFEDLAKGVRIYLSKESMKNLQQARNKDKLLHKLWIGLKVVNHLGFWYILSTILGLSMWQSLLILPIQLFLSSFI